VKSVKEEVHDMKTIYDKDVDVLLIKIHEGNLIMGKKLEKESLSITLKAILPWR
jgi:hypothetical protein